MSFENPRGAPFRGRVCAECRVDPNKERGNPPHFSGEANQGLARIMRAVLANHAEDRNGAGRVTSEPRIFDQGKAFGGKERVGRQEKDFGARDGTKELGITAQDPACWVLCFLHCVIIDGDRRQSCKFTC